MPAPAGRSGIIRRDDRRLPVVVARIQNQRHRVPHPLIGFLRAQVVQHQHFGGKDRLQQLQLRGSNFGGCSCSGCSSAARDNRRRAPSLLAPAPAAATRLPPGASCPAQSCLRTAAHVPPCRLDTSPQICRAVCKSPASEGSAPGYEGSNASSVQSLYRAGICAAAIRRCSRSASWHSQGRLTQFPAASITRTRPTPSQIAQTVISSSSLAHSPSRAPGAHRVPECGKCAGAKHNN